MFKKLLKVLIHYVPLFVNFIVKFYLKNDRINFAISKLRYFSNLDRSLQLCCDDNNLKVSYTHGFVLLGAALMNENEMVLVFRRQIHLITIPYV